MSYRVTAKASVQGDHPLQQDLTMSDLEPDNGLLVMCANETQDLLVGEFSC